MSPKITNIYSPNFNIPKRKNKIIKFIVIHYTGMKNENAAIKRLCNESKNVSAHYFIKNNGKMINLIPDLYIAWHAGKSRWCEYNMLNKNSIGIEIQNPGHNNGYKNFSSKQLNSLKLLLRMLIKKYRIELKNVIGHSDIAPERKKDPGEKFPWKKFSKYNLAIWHNHSEIELKKNRNSFLDKTDELEFMNNLYQIGYNKIKKLNLNSNTKFITKAFQRRFRQDLINGIPDLECFLISKNLLKS